MPVLVAQAQRLQLVLRGRGLLLVRVRRAVPGRPQVPEQPRVQPSFQAAAGFPSLLAFLALPPVQQAPLAAQAAQKGR